MTRTRRYLRQSDEGPRVPTPDYYNVLGVSRKASAEEIKRSYRTLAMRWHPDRNHDDPEAEQRFKDVTAAYKCLSDAEERARFDRLGPLYTADGRPPRPEELNEVVTSVFGNLFKRRRPARGEDLRYTVSITLEEVASGTKKDIVVPRRVVCDTCGGDGAAPHGGKRVCTVCDGSGRSTRGRLLRSDCYHCDGKGYEIVTPCPRCAGDGRSTLDDHIVVKVPAGVGTGQKLKVAGKGDAPRGTGPEGDLFVIVSVEDHALFRRRGEDLLVELPLGFVEMALGTEAVVPTLEGTTTIRVPAGTAPGRVFRLGGRGLPRLGRTARGDLHLEVTLEVPVALDEPRRRQLAEWGANLPPESLPRRMAFQRAVDERKGAPS